MATVEFDNYDDILTAISYRTMKSVSGKSQINFFEAVKSSEYINKDSTAELDFNLEN